MADRLRQYIGQDEAAAVLTIIALLTVQKRIKVTISVTHVHAAQHLARNRAM